MVAIYAICIILSAIHHCGVIEHLYFVFIVRLIRLISRMPRFKSFDPPRMEQIKLEVNSTIMYCYGNIAQFIKQSDI